MRDGTDPVGDAEDAGDDATGQATYVFGVRFRLAPTVGGVRTDPEEFETKLFRTGDPPGSDGWRFFRDNLWHGELGDPQYFREITEEALDVPVLSVDFRELRTDEAYLAALKAEIGADLEQFNADGVGEVVSKYLGSSIRVAPAGEIP
ncbi:MAG: LWR-salt protein [Haloarculaceae archaeon]